MNFLNLYGQQAARYNFFERAAEQPQTLMLCFVAALVSGGMIFAFMNAPQQMRRYIIGAFTFMSGLFYVLLWLWPANVSYKPGQIPNTPVESVARGLQETLPRVSDIAQILTGFLLLLGIISLLRIHITRSLKKNEEAIYSRILLVAMAAMAAFGFADWIQRQADKDGRLNDPENWGWIQAGKNLLFDGIYQQMEAAMFSIIAFFILSAAYRAFRVRSVESSVLMASALILMLSLMGVVTTFSSDLLASIADSTKNSFVENFKLDVVAGWVKEFLQTPSVRAIEFGVGLGALAMGLRLWLGLEKGGGGA